jgi:hypothetical protein
LSITLLRYPTGCGVGPWNWVSTPRARLPFSYTYSGKWSWLGKLRARADWSTSLRVWKAFLLSGSHSR